MSMRTGWGAAARAGASSDGRFVPYAAIQSADPRLFGALTQLHACLTDPQGETLHKQSLAVEFFTQLQQTLAPAPHGATSEPL